jgi:hypothetical protein
MADLKLSQKLIIVKPEIEGIKVSVEIAKNI